MAAFFDLIRRTPSQKNTSEKEISPAATATQHSLPEKEIWTGAPKIRTLFMGTPEFASHILSALIEEKYHIISVVTKQDKPVGRKQEETESAVKKTAQAYNLPLLQPERFDEQTIESIKKLEPDLIIVAAYGKILPKAILETPGFGCINVHASLLPKWRGASPIQNAILSGATETGVTVMLMDQGMDTGDILTQKKIVIEPDDTRESLSIRLTQAGTDLLLETLPRFIQRTIQSIPQKNDEATLCQLIEREDGHIMWTDTAESIYNRYRALYPWPGIFSFLTKDSAYLRLKLHRISYQKQSPQIHHPLGQIFETGEKIGVQTSEGVVFLEEVQLEGKNRLSIQEFLLGNKDIIGSFLR
ncbi:MAG: methionyl-tRNA formyltransferase [Candidatus Moranbacteria bacterium]|nr:methionyl-tRNA formyltransferase [Candidatus Moranbacteria bacterium]MDD3965105.1 methionyl-tRNA formyltransferase [Candidatus Moranbacteria bacterium]